MMDELERLRAAHAVITPPEPRTIEAARLRLGEAANADGGPAWADTTGSSRRLVAPSRADTTGTSRQLVTPSRDSAEQSPADIAKRSGGRAARPPRLRVPRRWLRVLAPAVVAAVGAVLAIALWPGDASTPAGPSTALAARACLQDSPGPAGPCLDALGDLAAADDVLAAGQVFYRRDLWSQSIRYVGPEGRPQAQPRGPGVYGIVRAGHEELWVAPDRSGRVEYGPPQRPYLPSAADERAWLAAGSPDLQRLAGGHDGRDDLPPRDFGPGELDEVLLGGGSLAQALPEGDPLRDLPTQPGALARALRRIAWFQRVRISGDDPCAPDLSDCSRSTRRTIDSVYGSSITALLRYPFSPPALRRSLLRVLGDVPGARRLGALRDPVGRRGAGILLPDPVNDGRNVVVFDLESGRLLADGRAEDGTVATLRWSGVYDLEVGGVDSVGDRPG